MASRFPDWEAVNKSALVLLSMDSLAAPVAEPMETRSPAVVRRIMEPSSVQPEAVGVVAEKVIFLSEVLMDTEALSPAAKVRVSVLEPASKVVVPTLMVLKILKAVV